ncbi:phosphoribosylanthranilate isomerase [Lachnoclostridium sp. An138]|uniref:phosphoribosylanthranilate isomerase n=1 Tax=Lachnoclostridium sp. An138 TaxID=1965560 RepID=UPI000B366195|nr:phosphoribosylanthranilate isomerase [Lachnoclostridium sp. An138]OUQ15507.1 N-(5'-phosphoribosyl)anthranilate isomerase [Lachnoclostridium sp. An138]
MTKIKICGLRRPQDIEAVNAARPDFAGFVVEVPGSRRSVDKRELRELAGRLEEGILSVGVFVNAPPELVAELLEEGTLDLAQLHGQEDEIYMAELRRLTEKPLIQAFSIQTGQDAERALESRADYLLLDQGRGGTGQTFDWSLLPEINRPFFLAGGLGEENLERAIRQVRPWAVDLSSSLETDGQKDPEKILRAVDLVRRLNRQQN